jgi:hypothetical protein
MVRTSFRIFDQTLSLFWNKCTKICHRSTYIVYIAASAMSAEIQGYGFKSGFGFLIKPKIIISPKETCQSIKSHSKNLIT